MKMGEGQGFACVSGRTQNDPGDVPMLGFTRDHHVTFDCLYGEVEIQVSALKSSRRIS